MRSGNLSRKEGSNGERDEKDPSYHHGHSSGLSGKDGAGSPFRDAGYLRGDVST